MPPPPVSLRHPGIVSQVGFTAEGARLVAFSSGSLRTVERVLPSGQKDTVLVYHPEITADTSPDDLPFGRIGQQNRLSSPRGKVVVWDLATRKAAELKPPPKSQVLAGSPGWPESRLTAADGKAVSSRSNSGIWRTGKAVGEATQLGVKPFEGMPSIQWAACSGDGKKFVAIKNRTLMLWDSSTGSPSELALRGREVNHAAISPDGKGPWLLRVDF